MLNYQIMEKVKFYHRPSRELANSP